MNRRNGFKHQQSGGTEREVLGLCLVPSNRSAVSWQTQLRCFGTLSASPPRSLQRSYLFGKSYGCHHPKGEETEHTPPTCACETAQGKARFSYLGLKKKMQENPVNTAQLSTPPESTDDKKEIKPGRSQKAQSTSLEQNTARKHSPSDLVIPAS